MFHRSLVPFAAVSMAATAALAPVSLAASRPVAATPPAVGDVTVVMADVAGDRAFGQSVADTVTRLRDGGMIGTLEVADGLGGDAAAAAAAIDRAVAGDVELIVVVGDEFDQALQDAASANPDQPFAWIAAPDAPDFAEVASLPNVVTIVPAAHQAGFLLGQLAAVVSPDPASLSLVVADASGTTALFGAGFAVGYTAAVEGSEVYATPEPAPGAALVVAGAFAAAERAASAESRVMTAGVDTTGLGDRFVASAVYRLDGQLYGVLEGIAAGSFTPGVRVATAAVDGVAVVVRPDAPIPAEARAAVERTLEEFRSGARDVVIDVATRERVDEGETLESIAGAAGVGVDELAERNGLTGAPETGTVLTTGRPTRVTAGASGSVTPNFVATTAPPATSPPAPAETAAPAAPAEPHSPSGGDTAPPAAQPPAQPAATTQPPEPAPTAPPATSPPPTEASVGGCQGMGVGTANDWRAAAGVGPLSSGGLGSCDWARHLAETGTFSHAGGVAEVIYMGGGCGGAWSGWQGSPPHYQIITDGRYSVGDFACVVRSDGMAYAVGRLS